MTISHGDLMHFWVTRALWYFPHHDVTNVYNVIMIYDIMCTMMYWWPFPSVVFDKESVSECWSDKPDWGGVWIRLVNSCSHVWSCVKKYYTSNVARMGKLLKTMICYDKNNRSPCYMCLHSWTPIEESFNKYFLKYSSYVLLLHFT